MRSAGRTGCGSVRLAPEHPDIGVAAAVAQMAAHADHQRIPVDQLAFRPLHLAAIVLDAEMNVVGANDSGRKLIGNIGTIDPDSPIYDFVESKKERQSIEINGVSRLAHIILSTARDKREGTMLICLE